MGSSRVSKARGTSKRKARGKRRIAVVTGTRAEYGLLKTCMRGIESHRSLELLTIVTGMHLLRPFGYTVRDIEADGFAIAARVPMQRARDTATEQAEGLGRGVSGIAKALESLRADMVLVLGDRIEAMAATLAALTTGRPVAHLHGGDVAEGDFDERIRRSISQIASLHLPASKAAARRLRNMGIDEQQIEVVGAPGLDRLFELAHELGMRGGMSAKPGKRGTALVVYHAFGRSPDHEGRIAKRIISAVRAAGLRPHVIFPNSDRGYSGVTSAIEALAVKFTDVSLYRSLPRDSYLKLLIESDVMIGNSSGGVIEAPSAGTPSVNVGGRQAGRQPGGASVVSCGESSAEIEDALEQALRKRPTIGRRGVYGDGLAGQRVAKALASFLTI